MTSFHAAALVSVTPKISAAPPSVMAIGDRCTNCWNGKEPETPILMGVEGGKLWREGKNGQGEKDEEREKDGRGGRGWRR